MNSKEAGVADAPAEEGGTPASEEQKPASPPTPQDGGTPKEPASDGSTPSTPAEGGEAPKEGPEKRVNDLMGKWRTEEHQHGETKSELQLYKDKFGDINAPPSQGQVTSPPSQDGKPSFLKEGWEPQTFAELQGALMEAAQWGASEALKGVEGQNTARAEAKEAVDRFVFEVKTADAEFDEKAFFEYANRNGFPVNNVNDLRAVYRSHLELRNATKTAAKDATDNKNERGKDTVNQPGSGSTPQKGGVPYSKIRSAGSAVDLVHDALNK